MLPDRVSNPGPLTYESGALPIALRGWPDKTASTEAVSDVIYHKLSHDADSCGKHLHHDWVTIIRQIFSGSLGSLRSCSVVLVIEFCLSQCQGVWLVLHIS